MKTAGLHHSTADPPAGGGRVHRGEGLVLGPGKLELGGSMPDPPPSECPGLCLSISLPGDPGQATGPAIPGPSWKASWEAG